NAEALGFNAAEDSVYLSIKDRWLKYLQGLGDDYKIIAIANGNGTYSASPSFTGPFAWHMIYNWGFYDVSELAYVEEGGGFGFGRSRARYQHANANNNCSWGDYTFPEDVWQSEPPLPVEEFNPDSICILLTGIGKDIVPDNFFLTNNYPNPFNPTTSFTFGISSSIEVKISIYNILGQKIFSYSNGKLDAGTYEFNWNGLNQIGDRVTSGIYFYEMEAGNQFRDIKKMTLLK
ncbi:MAG: FlgD immunoglobulin-like domain containing protein, partial [Candidatus Neomarinimicrobiota bacterium]|nr:FlgD immunoglobulin-like domain containing protein [Candidatus Neomarinimicrobiota bacterium]